MYCVTHNNLFNVVNNYTTNVVRIVPASIDEGQSKL